MADKKFWIQDAIKRPGALRRALKAKKGKNIPKSKVEEAAKAPGRLGRMGRLALTLSKFHR